MSRYLFGTGTLAILLFCLGGCATSSPPERGPDGTIAYHVAIETSEPGMRIEMNNDFLGRSPLTIKIFGDRDGTFHNFGANEVFIRAIPEKGQTNLFVQTKVFRTGGWFAQEDKIPSRIYFDMSQKTSGFTVDLPPRY